MLNPPNDEMTDRPIFVRGVSRSGGTLLVTILDAHPEIAMSYELYPDLLYTDTGRNLLSRMFFRRKIKGLIKLFSTPGDTKSLARSIKDKNLRTFFLRCLRGNMDSKSFVRLLLQHSNEGSDFSNVQSCLRFIGNCGIEKMNKMNKSRWGMKCTSQFNEYLEMWPRAYFINIIRDGRDVLASQLNTGKFNRHPAETARRWVETHKLFKELVRSAKVKAYEVYYEKLVCQPREEIKKLCGFLEIAFDESMLEYYAQDLTIYNEPTGHLSFKRIIQPIDMSMIGRWKRDLNKQHLEEFYAIAMDTMSELGYIDKEDPFSP